MRTTASALLIAGAASIAASFAPCAAAQAGAQKYPDKPVRFIVPFPPGGGNGILARAIGLKLE